MVLLEGSTEPLANWSSLCLVQEQDGSCHSGSLGVVVAAWQLPVLCLAALFDMYVYNLLILFCLVHCVMQLLLALSW